MSTTAVPTALKTGHVGLNVTDLDRSLAFYGRVFGFDVQAEGTDADPTAGRSWAAAASCW